VIEGSRAVTPGDVATLLRAVDFPWWIAGGWAIDLLRPQPRRVHQDVDVAVLRRDQARLRRALADWDLRFARPDGALAGGLSVLAPEIVLLYKAKSPGPADEEDFGAALGLLDGEAREWLQASISRCHPGHRWLARL
jgi:hypothetical protein